MHAALRTCEENLKQFKLKFDRLTTEIEELYGFDGTKQLNIILSSVREKTKTISIVFNFTILCVLNPIHTFLTIYFCVIVKSVICCNFCIVVLHTFTTKNKFEEYLRE
jgi:hypothetical protein